MIFSSNNIYKVSIGNKIKHFEKVFIFVLCKMIKSYEFTFSEECFI